MNAVYKTYTVTVIFFPLPSSQSLVACLSVLSNRNVAIYEGIRSSEWVAPPDELVDGEGPTTFKFTEDGYGDSGYNIYNYQKIDTGHSYEKVKCLLLTN